MHSNSLILKTSRTFHFSSLQRAHFKYHFYVLLTSQTTCTSWSFLQSNDLTCTSFLSTHSHFSSSQFLYFSSTSFSSHVHFMQSFSSVTSHDFTSYLSTCTSIHHNFCTFPAHFSFFSLMCTSCNHFLQSPNMTLIHISQRALQYTTISVLFQHFSFFSHVHFM